MNFEWHVKVRDGGGANVTDAQVLLVPASALTPGKLPFDAVAATHAHKSDGAYEPTGAIAPAAGDWALIVRRKGSSPVVQPLALKVGSGGDFSVSARGGTVATVAFASAVSGGTRSTAFTVKLLPSAEVVFISGVDYSGSAVVFRLFAEGHALALFREKKIDAGTRVTLFSCEDRSRLSLALGASGKLVPVDVEVFGTGPKPGKDYRPSNGADPAVNGRDISAVDFYSYLTGVGTAEKRRVKEVGIFSHSWPGGPILYDTNDTSTTDDRDPDDFDLRQKDFKPGNVAAFGFGIKDAMAADGRWQIWGCSATTFFKDAMREALKVKDANQLFDVLTETTHHDGSKSERNQGKLTRQRVRRMMDGKFRKGSYMAEAANFLGLSVFGAPPGVGADYSKVDGLDVMGIQGNTPPYAFFAQDFSPDFAPIRERFNFGYVDYKKMQARAQPAAAPFDVGVHLLTVSFDDKKSLLALASAKQPPPHAGAEVKLKVTAKKDFPAAGRSGVLYVIEDADKTRSEAFYEQTDGKVFKVTADGAGNFTVVGAQL